MVEEQPLWFEEHPLVSRAAAVDENQPLVSETAPAVLLWLRNSPWEAWLGRHGCVVGRRCLRVG